LRLPADAAREFSGIELDRNKPLRFVLDGRSIAGFAGDTVLTALLATGTDTFGTLGDAPLGLGEGFAPLIASRNGTPLPIDRLPAADGAGYATIGPRKKKLFGGVRSLGHRIDEHRIPVWSGATAEDTLSADLLVVGGGIAGLSAADVAATSGKSVILIDRRPWLGGDARYFGPVGDEESPATLTVALIERLKGLPNVQLLTNTEAFSFSAASTLVHRIVTEAGSSRGSVVAITAPRIVLATGSAQRLPVFAGNRLPGIVSTVSAYHLAKRYGVCLAPIALVSTQSNYAYRLALRLHDTGIAIRRIIDARINPQSRFVDFAKASGLNLGSGQFPLTATVTRHGLSVAFANVGTSNAATTLDTGALIVSGGFQPELALWMLAGGSVRWSSDRLEAAGHLDHVALAGSALGYKSLQACGQSGKVAVAQLFGEPIHLIEDVEIGASFETPDAPTPMAPATLGTAFLDSGASLVRRPTSGALAGGQALTIGDVTASVALGLIAANDAAAVAEERGAPGGPLVASSWTPVPKPAPEFPPYLAGRFGKDPRRLHLIVDDKCQFEPGALVYSNLGKRDAMTAIGIIVAAAEPGGTAIVQASADTDRFVVETIQGPSPARIKS